MSPRIRLIDAFVGPNARGNPAGVVLLDAPAEEVWMQSVAEEMNQAETAFSWPEGDSRRLRWFTPAAEVNLCGHATLATAHALFSDDELLDVVHFETRSGRLTCRRQEAAIAMDFPAQPLAGTELPNHMVESVMGLVEWQGQAGADMMIVLNSEQAVRSYVPDYPTIAALPARGLIITAPGEEFDIVSRFFAPQFGIPEDPVTGSAHCAMAPYWAARLGRTKLTAFQASKRGGILRLAVEGDRVKLVGKATTTLDGTLLMT